MRRVPAIAAWSIVSAYGTLQVLGRCSGSTVRERHAHLSGDELIAEPQLVTNHAITIHARPDAIWPWISQMGWHLGGYYTPHWVDVLLFPDNWASLDRLDPHLVRELEIGDVIPDGKPGTAHYLVAQVQAPHLLLLKSTTHLPPGWGERLGARFTWTWCFTITDLGNDSSRVHVRVRGHSYPWWLTALYVTAVVPADHIMATAMLRGLKTRVERGAPPAASGREPMREAGYGG